MAEKSLGHALGPAAILFSLGYSDKSSEVKSLMKFFKHYLIARQLNDDAHDWEKDLKMGHINAVGAAILKNIKTKEHKDKGVVRGQLSNIKSNELFQRVFWYEVVVDVCQTVLNNVQLARKALQQISIITDPRLFERILVKVEESAKKALKEREETLKFLKAYEN